MKRSNPTTPVSPGPPSGLSRRGLLAVGAAFFGGCTAPLMRGQSPEADPVQLEEETSRTRLVGDYTGAWGTNYIPLESVGLVTGLAGTGSDPPTSVERNLLISEMQSHEVRSPNEVLASLNTSLVMVRAFLPPNVQKRDVFDVEVRLPNRSETTSLRGGWLMRSRLRQVAVLGGGLHTGSVEGLAEGELLVDAAFENNPERIHETRGRILGGGVSVTERQLGLGIRRQDKSIRTSIAIATAISGRFHTFDHGTKKGVAEPKRDNFIELAVAPRYRSNLARYLRVVRSIALHETPPQRVERIALLEGKLLNPPSAARAAIELEAIGKDGMNALKAGLQSNDPEVRFYAAESLAYQDIPEAAPPLGQIAANSHALRWHALSALTVMDHVAAYEALNELLHVESVECRYGAFRALSTRNALDPLVRGEAFGEKFSYHIIPSNGEPLVHVARSRRPEVVLFGTDIRLANGGVLLIGKNFVVRPEGDNDYQVIKLVSGDDNSTEFCTNQLDQIIRAMMKQGAGYEEVIQLLQVAKKENTLQARLAFEAVARPGRSLDRSQGGPSAEAGSDLSPPENPLTPEETVPDDSYDPSGESEALELPEGELAELTVDRATTPESDIFRDPLSRQTEKIADSSPKSLETYVDPAYKKKPSESWWSKMGGWWK